MLRNVDLHPVPHPEQELGAGAVDDEVVERRQERGALGRRDAPETRTRQHVVRLAKTLHLHAREGSILLERGDDLGRHEPSERIRVPELLDCGDAERGESPRCRVAGSLLRWERAHRREPLLGQDPHTLAAGPGTGGHVAVVHEEGEHLRDVAVVRPARRAPAT